jgi:hypothetical protein
MERRWQGRVNLGSVRSHAWGEGSVTGGDTMPKKVTIYRYDYTDTKLGQPARAKRMGTIEYIDSVNGWIVEGSEMEVDASVVDAEGKTETGFGEPNQGK